MNAPHVNGVPVTLASLANRPFWVAWQTESREDGKPTKVPYAPAGYKAKANDPKTWGDRARAELRAAALPKPYGVGGVGLELGTLSPEHGFGGVDLDTCRTTDGVIEPWAMAVIELFRSYAEVSPSGTGVKVFFTYALSDLEAIHAVLRDARGKLKWGEQWKRGNGGDHPPAIELYLGNRFFAVTDNHLEGTPTEFRLIPKELLLDLITHLGPAFASAGGGRKKLDRSAKAMGKGARARRAGMSFEEMCQELASDPETADWYSEKGQANGKRELKRIWDKADSFDPTEDGAALAFAKQYRDRLRFCHHTGKWFEWDGNLWRKEETKLAFSLARRTCRDMGLRKAAQAAAVERFAQADRAFAVTSEIWDRDQFLLGTPAGTVDLRTGRLRPAIQGDYITKATAVVPDEAPECPLWLKFLEEATRGDQAFIRFLQQWCGYCLTGDIREHALLFAFGPGGNGKGVFLNTVARIMGDYATIAAMDTFIAAHGDKHPTDLAMLRGARLVCASETEEGRAWAESKIKAMTGGDPITARFMRQDFFTYQPHFKLTIIGNHRPVLRNVDDAARRRFNLAPFLFKPPVVDQQLEEKLKAEWPSILRWMIDGCLDWQANGLIRPDVVRAATDEYFCEQDLIQAWIDECCMTKPANYDLVQNLYASWKEWAERVGERPGSQKWFSQALRAKGYSPHPQPGTNKAGFDGLAVRPRF